MSFERALGGNGLFTPRYPFTWLCAKRSKTRVQKESFRMFTEMLDSLKHHVITTLTRVKVRTQEEIEEAERARQEMAEREALTHQPVDENTEQAQSEDYSDRHIGRNEPCPCGSGKKYKHCHGSKARYAKLRKKSG